MVVAFSFCQSDKPQAVRLAHWIRRLGGVENHSCLIVHPSSTDASGIEEPLREAFRYVEVLRYDPQFSGWPQGPNEQHARTAQFLLNHQRLTGPWLFMEADCVVTNSHWLNRLDTEYRLGGMPMLGALNNTVETATGRVVGKHTTGVAIYPQDFARICPLVRSMITTSAEYIRGGQLPPAFDCYYEAYTVPITHVSSLIQHFWKSDEFREEDGRIVCHFHRPYEGAPTSVDSEAVLIHGCKDSSLLDILEARKNAGVPFSQPQGSQVVKREVAPATTPSANGHDAPREAAMGGSSPPVETPVAEAIREITEAEMDAPPGAAMPPFPEGTPECSRYRELYRLYRWVDLQKYAAHKLKIKAFGIRRPELTNAVVFRERELGKEAWVREAQSAIKPAVPLEPVWQWAQGDGSNTPISDVQYKRMMALRQQHEAQPA